MSFQAYLDNIEAKTGPRASSLHSPTTDFDLGRGHAMALVHVIRNGSAIDAHHVNSGTTHNDASDALWLDGKKNRPASP